MRESGNSGNESVTAYTMSEGVLTTLMDNSFTSYFIHQGQPLGFEYEMLKLFADENNLTLDVKIIGNVESILDSLLAGKGDLVASNLSISGERMERVDFSTPLLRTRQVLVQRLPDNRSQLTNEQIEDSLIRDRLDLDGKTVMVRKNSSYELILKNLIEETGIDINIDFSPGDLVTEQLIEMVANKEIDYTLCDENKAVIFLSYYDNIDISTPMSLSQPIAWAIRKGSNELQDEINQWIENRKGSLEFNMITNRYFEMNRSDQRFVEREYDYIKEGKISNYDKIIKKYAETLNWDWRLLTAQIYKESKFDPTTRSWRGAIGLMQLMPRTARSYGLQPSDLLVPEKNISAGTKHLRMLEDQWREVLNDSLEIMKFTLGSYNVGKGHVDDAIRLAEKYGLEPNRWDENVAQMLINKAIPKYYKDPVVLFGYCRGREPVNYVETIFDDYELYRQFTN
jgi:membrane-bound lytic murein transglycosylase F